MFSHGGSTSGTILTLWEPALAPPSPRGAEGLAHRAGAAQLCIRTPRGPCCASASQAGLCLFCEDPGLWCLGGGSSSWCGFLCMKPAQANSSPNYGQLGHPVCKRDETGAQPHPCTHLLRWQSLVAVTEPGSICCLASWESLQTCAHGRRRLCSAPLSVCGPFLPECQCVWWTSACRATSTSMGERSARCSAQNAPLTISWPCRHPAPDPEVGLGSGSVISQDPEGSTLGSESKALGGQLSTGARIHREVCSDGP